MEFRTRVGHGQEVRFVEHAPENIKWPEDGRWRLSITELDLYLSDQLKEKSFGKSISRFVFCFEIADIELCWGGKFFRETADYTSYRPKSKEILSVGQLRWSDVKLLGPGEQLEALRGAIQASILRIGTKARKPRDFDYVSFAASVDHFLTSVPEKRLAAVPACLPAHSRP